MKLRSTLFIVLAISLIQGCAVGVKRFDEIMVDKVGKKAAYDFSCSPEKLQITKIDHGSYGVKGCDNEATYVGVNGYCSASVKGESYVIEGCRVVADTFKRQP